MARRNGVSMQLVAIGYADMETAAAAMDELEHLACDVTIRRDEVATIVRDEHGTFKVETNAVTTGGDPSWAMLWTTLFATLFFAPVLRMPIGADLAPIVRKVEQAGVDPEFASRARDMVAPETSALFVLVKRLTPDELVSALEVYGGTVLQCEISPEAQMILTETLDGRSLVA
jgi:uncharacterized membrane protein